MREKKNKEQNAHKNVLQTAKTCQLTKQFGIKLTT